MTIGKNRVRLGVEQMEDRCTPSAMVGLADYLPAQHGAPPAEAAALVRTAPGHAVPFNADFQCSVDLSSGTVSSTGSSTSYGKGGLDQWTWTALGHADTISIGAVEGVYSGTGTLVASNGDQMFYTFTTSWELATGEGTHVIIATGGTGRFAGATGRYTGQCIITADPASPTTFHCESDGRGLLFLPLPEHDALSRKR